MSFSIDIKDQVTEAVGRFQDAARSGRANPIIGRNVAARLQKNFYTLDAQRANQIGGRRTNFYGQAAKSTQYQSTVDEVRVSVNQVGVRQRLEGGLITPVKSKWLTIPAIAEAYGKRAREFNNLRVAFGRGHKPIGLEEAPPKNLRGKRGYARGGRIVFWLVKSVLQKADPSVVPTNEELTKTAVLSASTYFSRLWERANRG
jgi:hypothetical protein